MTEGTKKSTNLREQLNERTFLEQLKEGITLVERYYNEALVNEYSPQQLSETAAKLKEAILGLGLGGEEALKVFRPYLDFPPSEWAEIRMRIYAKYNRKTEGNGSTRVGKFMGQLPSRTIFDKDAELPNPFPPTESDPTEIPVNLRLELKLFFDVLDKNPDVCVVLPISATAGSYVMKIAIQELKRVLISQGKAEIAASIKSPYFMFLEASRFRGMPVAKWFTWILSKIVETDAGSLDLMKLVEHPGELPGVQTQLRNLIYETIRMANKIEKIGTRFTGKIVFLDEAKHTGATLRQAWEVMSLAVTYLRKMKKINNVSIGLMEMAKVSDYGGLSVKMFDWVDFAGGEAKKIKINRPGYTQMHDFWLADKMTLARLNNVGKIIGRVAAKKVGEKEVKIGN